MIQQSVRKEGLSRFRITSQHAVGLSQRIGGTDVSENNGSHVNVQVTWQNPSANQKKSQRPAETS